LRTQGIDNRKFADLREIAKYAVRQRQAITANDGDADMGSGYCRNGEDGTDMQFWQATDSVTMLLSMNFM